tara:strand:- start:3012 stop:4457 length:1446 start_codon:yes stop_codon:yes gene_type:complete
MNYRNLCVGIDESLRRVGEVHQASGEGVACVVDSKGTLRGTLSDGDFRRALLSGANLDDTVVDYMNPNPFAMRESARLSDLAKRLSDYKIIPLVDSNGILVDFYSNKHVVGIPVSQPALKGNEIKYVMECLETNWISSQGKYVNQLESNLKDYVGAKDCVAVSNGTVAIQLALSVLGIGPGDEVIVPSLTFGATANAVLAVGASPCFVDIDEDNLNLDIEKTIAAINSNTKAIIPVDLYGVPFQMKLLRSRLKSRPDISVIQDCAESLGAYESGRHTGGYADVCTFSFFANKIITCGEGGAICFFKDGISQKARIMRDHGMDPEQRYHHLYPGFNFRITNIQAAIGCAQLERIDEILVSRRNIFDLYDRELEGLQLRHQSILETSITSPWLYTFRLPGGNVEALQEFMKSKGIDTRRIFAPLHNMSPFKKFKDYGSSSAENSYQFGISLPTFSGMSNQQVQFVADMLKQGIEQNTNLEVLI